MKKLLVCLLLAALCLSCAMAEDRYDQLGYYGENGFMPVQQGGLWGVIAPDGTLVVPCEWEEIGEVVYGGIAVKRDGLWGCLDMQGRVVAEPAWDFLSIWPDGTLSVERDDWEGLLAADGTVIVPCGQYTYVGWNIDGYLFVMDEQGRCGKLNPDGSVAIPLEWQDIGYFHDGLAYAKRMNDGWRYINTAGKTVITGAISRPGDFRDGLALVETTYGKYRFIDVNGAPLTPSDWDDAKEFSCGLALVKRDGLYGYIDRAGEVVIPLQFTSASSFYDGVALVRRGEERIAIDTQGGTLYTCTWEKASGQFSRGFIWVMQDGRYGLMNTAGELVVPCEWDQPVAIFLHGDMTHLERDGQLGFVNRQGELVTGRLWDKETVSWQIQDEYLFLLEDGVLSIWNADGTRLY